MFWDSTYKIGRVIGPVLIHYLVANIIKLTGLHADAALLTSAAAVFVLPLFLWMYREDMHASEEEGGHMGILDYLVIAVLSVVSNIVLTVAVNWLIQVTGIRISNAAQESLFASNLLVQLLGIGLLVPFMEEVLFRGLVYGRLRGYTKSEWTAVFGSAVIFAVYHGNLIQGLFAFPMGIILALVYRRWGTIKAPVFFHVMVNISSVVMTAVMSALL